MMRNLTIVFIIVILSFPAARIIGQEKPKTDTQSKSETKPVSTSDAVKDNSNPGNKEKNKEETEEQASILRQRGLLLLRQSGEEASGISDGRMASQVQSKAADLLWDYDKVAARKLFESAFDIAVRY